MPKTIEKQARKIKEEGKSTDFDLSVQVSDRVQIQDVFMISSNVNQLPGVAHGELVVEVSQSLTANLQGDNIITVFASYRLEGRNQDKANEEVQLYIEAHYLLAYAIEETKGITQECIDAFARTNGGYNAWPYWREFVQSTVQRMGLPKVVLPVFRLGSTKKPAEKKISSRKAKASKKK